MAKFKKPNKPEPKNLVIPIVAKAKGEVVEPNVKQPKPFTTEDFNLACDLQRKGYKLRTVEGPNPYHKGNLYIFQETEEQMKEVSR